MPEALVSEGLWEVIGPLLPAESPKPKGGRPRIPDRAVLAGIVYVLKSGVPWRMLPKELGRSYKCRIPLPKAPDPSGVRTTRDMKAEDRASRRIGE